MSFEFRLRFHLLPEDRLACTETHLELPPPARHLRIAAWQRDTSIDQSPRIFLIGGPYDSMELASADGQRARRAMLLWALQRRLAIDLGDSRRRGGFTPVGAEWFSKQFGGPVRQQLHGLDVYEHQEGQLFIDIHAQPGLRIGPEGATASIANWYGENRQLSEKQELAAELFCSAHFDAPFRSRFLTLMTAIEALLDHQPRPAAVIAVVKALEATVGESSLEPRAKQSILTSLERLHQESIRQAGCRVASTLLPGGRYAGVDPKKYFLQCYDLRSTIVHTGHVPGDVDLLEVTNELHRFVGDLLHAAIGVPVP